jgi:mRNA interferase MazF
VSGIPAQGEIWRAEAEDERRTVLVVSRSASIPVLTGILVASFDNLQPVRRAFLTERVGALGVEQADVIYRALTAMADC